MDSSSSAIPSSPDSPYHLLLLSLSLIPISHYMIAFSAIIALTAYNFFEWHFFQDFFGGLRGQPVTLTFNSDSKIYHGIASKCRVLCGRYLATPWLASPHVQTAFLNFFSRPPNFTYTRKIFRTVDGGTLALDWLLNSDVIKGSGNISNGIAKDDPTPLVIVVPGLTSDSECPFLKHLVYNTAKSGWNVVVGNHIGLGDVSITSDIFHNAGWTEDLHAIVHYLHNEYPCAPLYLIGTSIGANVVVKYLGEEGDNIHIAGAVAVCSPWDILIGDRYMGRRFKQKLYDLAVASGLKEYAELHQSHFSRLANWKGIEKARRIRDFDSHCTIIVGKYEIHTIGNVVVPVMWEKFQFPSSALVPWMILSAQRKLFLGMNAGLNKNIILATTKHGGHLAFFEGITGSSQWWVRATNEFLSILHQSPYTHTQKKMKTSPPPEPCVDHSPFVNVAEDGTLASVANEQTTNTDENYSTPEKEINKKASLENQEELMTESTCKDSALKNEQEPGSSGSNFVKRHLYQLSRHSKRSLWLLIVSSWPLVGTALYFLFKKKVKGEHVL